jgi:hypothetical protein
LDCGDLIIPEIRCCFYVKISFSYINLLENPGFCAGWDGGKVE